VGPGETGGFGIKEQIHGRGIRHSPSLFRQGRCDSRRRGLRNHLETAGTRRG
jgi:hypothetical protein